MKEIIINEKNAGGRLDKLVCKYLDIAPSSFIYKMLRKKNIVLNDKKAEGKEILKPGDSIKLYLADDTIDKFKTPEKMNTHKTSAGKTDISSYLVFEDENIIALNKPSGLLSQKVKVTDFCINDILLSYLGSDKMFTPGISNRLDRNTSGLVLAAKNPNAVRVLNEAIKSRKIGKKYLCIVKGKVAKSAEIEGYLTKDEVRNIVKIEKTGTDQASYIKTIYRPISVNDAYSLLEVDLITGKSHQIRAHLASVGHPIIGDEKYGEKKDNVVFRLKYKVNSQLLHAYKMEFVHMDGILSYLNGNVIICPIPNEFTNVLKGENLCLPGDLED